MPSPSTPALARTLGDWSIERMGAGARGLVTLHLRHADGRQTIQAFVAPVGSTALAQTRLGAVGYLRCDGLDAHAAAKVVRRLAQALDAGDVPLHVLFPHLALGRTQAPDETATVARLLSGAARPLLPSPVGAPPPALDVLTFDPPGVAALLAPEVRIDVALPTGPVLRSISPAATGRREDQSPTRVVLEFELPSGNVVRLGLDARPRTDAVGQAGPLHVHLVGHTSDDAEVEPSVLSLASWLLVLLRARIGPATDVRIARDLGEWRALSVPAGRGALPAPDAGPGDLPPDARALNLALDAECGQACVFCSVKSYVKPSDGGDPELASALRRMRGARDAGATELRLNGIDPLAFSRVLDVVGAARDLGFETLAVYSPSRRFADPVFRRAFLARAPARIRLTIPLYGVTAATHDAVTGTPGAFQQVLNALDALTAETPPGSLRLSTVVVRQNLHEYAALASFAAKRGLGFEPKLAYPMRQTVRDPYVESAVRESDVARALVAALEAPCEDRGALLTLGAAALPHPCVLVEAERQSGFPLFGAVAASVSDRRLPGTEYRDDAIVHAEGGGSAESFAVSTVPCRHVTTCALAPACPREHYAIYHQQFGDAEFQPVAPLTLYTLQAHPALFGADAAGHLPRDLDDPTRRATRPAQT